MSPDVSQENPLAAEPYVEPLWMPLALFAPLRARLSGPMPQPVFGISIDTRTLMPGDLFFAIKGERSDGHDHVAAAFAKGAAAAVVDEDHADSLKGAGPLYVVARCVARPRRACRRRPGAHAGTDRRRHRLCRQDDDEGGTASRSLASGRDACVRRILQQSLGRAADLGADAARHALWRHRDRHEPRGRDSCR